MPTAVTGRPEKQRSFLICSSERAVKKHAGETAKTFLPAATNPAATPTRFCSAMPTSTIWPGAALAKGASLAEPRVACHDQQVRILASKFQQRSRQCL